jgi:hypothetical protein
MTEEAGLVFFGFFLLWIVLSILSGLIGLFFGAKVNHPTLGFWLGFFLNAVGWIIVLLLPGVQESKEVSSASRKKPPRTERDLESDAYKLWLGKTYAIKKNELFEKYEFDDKLFETLDEALVDAHQREVEKEERLGGVGRNRQERQKSEVENVYWIVGITGSFLFLLILISIGSRG